MLNKVVNFPEICGNISLSLNVIRSIICMRIHLCS